ncbi:MAG TPA: PAS domain-containing protein, partial [Burkholderiales bacterium]|nr:PAS domain-containing protein [Burkholderiales bacterium]
MHVEPEEDPAALSLDERGMILDCNRAAEKLSGYLKSELMWRHVSLLLPQLLAKKLISGDSLNPQLNFLCHCGHLFHLQHREGGSL